MARNTIRVKRRAWPRSAGGVLNAPNNKAAHIANKAQPSIKAAAGSIGLTIHHAVANNNKPKKWLMASIQGPAFGSKARDPAPTISKSKPWPQAMANKAQPPKK